MQIIAACRLKLRKVDMPSLSNPVCNPDLNKTCSLTVPSLNSV